MNNHRGTFRPLIGGIRIVNPACALPGTLGFIAESPDHSARFIVSCYHVLLRPPGEPAAGIEDEPVFQPGPAGFDLAAATEEIARAGLARADAQHDCAAARLHDRIEVRAEVLELGQPADEAEPAVGMLVVKSGMRTGVTEGVIKRVDGNFVRIEPRTSAPSDYELSHAGDSGAVWFERATLRPVALHRRGNVAGPEFALATRIQAVLAALGLTFLRS